MQSMIKHLFTQLLHRLHIFVTNFR
jgi:hypothetical protein